MHGESENNKIFQDIVSLVILYVALYINSETKIPQFKIVQQKFLC